MERTVYSFGKHAAGTAHPRLSEVKGYTQQELASGCGISLTLLGAIERGNRRADERTLAKIAEVLGISLEELTNP